MRHGLLIAALTLVLSLLVRVETTRADALGLPTGTYNITLDFSGGTTYDASGTISIGSGFVTAFHVDNNATLGFFDCEPCLVGGGADLVMFNGSNFFQIEDGDTQNVISLFSFAADGTADVSLSNLVDATINVQGTASVPISGGGGGGGGGGATVPEPQSAPLLLLGLAALGLRARMRRQA